MKILLFIFLEKARNRRGYVTWSASSPQSSIPPMHLILASSQVESSSLLAHMQTLSLFLLNKVASGRLSTAEAPVSPPGSYHPQVCYRKPTPHELNTYLSSPQAGGASSAMPARYVSSALDASGGRTGGIQFESEACPSCAFPVDHMHAKSSISASKFAHAYCARLVLCSLLTRGVLYNAFLKHLDPAIPSPPSRTTRCRPPGSRDWDAGIRPRTVQASGGVHHHIQKAALYSTYEIP